MKHPALGIGIVIRGIRNGSSENSGLCHMPQGEINKSIICGRFLENQVWAAPETNLTVPAKKKKMLNVLKF